MAMAPNVKLPSGDNVAVRYGAWWRHVPMNTVRLMTIVANARRRPQ